MFETTLETALSKRFSDITSTGSALIVLSNA